MKLNNVSEKEAQKHIVHVRLTTQVKYTVLGKL